MKAMLHGATAGVVATIPMTGVLWLSSRAGLIHTPPPKKITKRAGKKVGVNTDLVPHPVMQFGWIAGHFAYGGLAGVLFVLLRRVLPRAVLTAGAFFGGLLWAVGYSGYLPALGLYPAPDKDTRSRTAVMVLAHLVFGTALAAAHRLTAPSGSPSATSRAR